MGTFERLYCFLQWIIASVKGTKCRWIWFKVWGNLHFVNFLLTCYSFSRKIAKSIPVKKTTFKKNRPSFRIISFIIVGFISVCKIFELGQEKPKNSYLFMMGPLFLGRLFSRKSHVWTHYCENCWHVAKIVLPCDHYN